ncbi:UPAR/Ly6 domain-containing protein bero [Drosophila tropicalis]|uniref:UPAR/Ly6 domain-containing protein bero n=1 Tax=Drosophila tropicalis TaxID=46794 RepID=UPI0035ABE6D0
MAMRAFVLTLWLLVMLTDAARAITCYECDSVNDKGCGDGDNFQPDDIAKTNCDALEVPEYLRTTYLPPPDTACQTKYYKGSLEEPLFVRRSCYFGDVSSLGFQCDEQPDAVAPSFSFLACSICNNDLCNTAATYKSAYWFLLIALPILWAV